MTTRKGLLPTIIGVLLMNLTIAQTTTSVPARVAFVPTLSTQGKADPQTSSNFSFNILGGITGSVNGVEVGGLFNINRKSVSGVQVGGLFNSVGDDVKAVQVGGLYNTVNGDFRGVQVGGITNYVRYGVEGLQVSGIYNHAGKKLTGVQVAGISNFARENVKGIQIAGIGNFSGKGTSALQIGGIVNYAKHLRGLQIGLINIADTSSGFSLGLINVVAKGYHKVAVYTNEVLNLNVAYKSGNPKLYNILLAGVNAGEDDKVFSYGYGLGHEIAIGNKITLNPELTTQYMYLGNWHYTNLLTRFQLNASIKLSKGVAIFGGAAFSAYYTDQGSAVHGYKFKLPSDNYHTYKLWNNNTTGWIGWQAGISFF